MKVETLTKYLYCHTNKSSLSLMPFTTVRSNIGSCPTTEVKTGNAGVVMDNGKELKFEFMSGSLYSLQVNTLY